MMSEILYDIATTCAAPVGAAYLALSSRHRPLLARFAPSVPEFVQPPVWLHACSVGEVGVVKPLVEALHSAQPNVPLLVTYSTASGRTRTCEVLPDTPNTWFPFDVHPVVARFFATARPRLLALAETEIWPNVIRVAVERSVPVVLVNARISAKHFARYRRSSWLMRSSFGRLTAIGVQNEEYAARFVALGAHPDRIRVTGNTKFDGLVTEVEREALVRLRAQCGFDGESRVLLFGSTRPGDEVLAAACWNALRSEIPGLKLVVAPRHAQRLSEVVAPFKEPILLRTESRAGRTHKDERVIVIDTVGELVSFYALASVAVIGGSFFPGVNGHNPLEAAALGIPTVFGPYMSNFPDPARVLLESGGAVQVPASDQLLGALRILFTNAERRAEIGRRGREAVLANQGALSRTLDLILGSS